MRRALLVLGLVVWAGLLCACGGSGTGAVEDEVGPLRIALLAATPSSGSSPLRVTFTANIAGGKAPYYYAWDYTNDGAIDLYLNNQFNRTIAIQNDYFLKASDAGGVTQYEAVLHVTDSENTTVTSDPVQVVVQGSSGVTFDPGGTFWFTDQQNPDGSYTATTGEPVFFRALPVGGKLPYVFQWDFDSNGTVDSTVQAPQYTFTYNEPGSRRFFVHLTVVDDNGEMVTWDFEVDVESGLPVPPVGEFLVILNSSPEAIPSVDPELVALAVEFPGADQVIGVDFDPTGTNENVPLQPELDLAVVVHPDPSKGGVPPYEYYWDFENDHAIDNTFVSPTIPFYDDDRKIIVNPYALQPGEYRKRFLLRCMVIDGSGAIAEVYRSVISTNVSGHGLPDLQVTPTYGESNAAGSFTVLPPMPYAASGGLESAAYMTFNLAISGGTGTYQWQLDVDGNGTPDAPLVDTSDPPDGVPDTPGWGEVGQLPYTVTFGPYDNDSNEATPDVIDFHSVGYYPVRVDVRTLDPATQSQTDIVTLQVPVSLVERKEMAYEGTLKPRADHGAAATWNVVAGGPNDQYLESREMIIVGGRQGTTPLREVEVIRDTFTPPGVAGDVEVRVALTGGLRLPMTQERHSAMVWSDADYYYVHGGYNLVNGILGASENVPVAGGAWNPTASEIRIPEYYPLRDAMGAFYEPDVTFIFCGGVHPPDDSDSDNVSGKTLLYRPLTFPNPFLIDTYGDLLSPMVTERYDGCAGLLNDRLYAVGGRVASGQSVSTVEAYNLNSGQWETGPATAADMLDKRSGACCQVIVQPTAGGGSIELLYVLGGAWYPNDESAAVLVPTAEVFNPTTATWSYSLPPTNVVENAASVALPAPGGVSSAGASVNAIWYFGGEGTMGETDGLEEFIYFYTVFPAP